MRHAAKRFLLAAILLQTQPLSASATPEEAGAAESLAAFLRAARSVISSHQDRINDPRLAEKNLSGGRVAAEAAELFAKQEGEAPGEIEDDLPRRLIDAQMAAVREVVDEHQPLIDERDVAFKGFIPAVFARLVNERFAEKAGDLARVKVTAPLDLVRNRKARPDEWERAVIESRFLREDWPRGEPFSEEVEVGGRPAFRMLFPEYYTPSCLSCHGEPKGEMDVTGYPKEGGRDGDLGGVISVTLFR